MVKQRTQLINMIRGLLAEFGDDISKGLERALGAAGGNRSSMVKHQMCRLKLRRSSARYHSRRSTHTFGFARLIVICSFGNVATMLPVVLWPSPVSGRSARHSPHRSPIRIA
jgi:hypothetical protein